MPEKHLDGLFGRLHFPLVTWLYLVWVRVVIVWEAQLAAKKKHTSVAPLGPDTELNSDRLNHSRSLGLSGLKSTR